MGSGAIAVWQMAPAVGDLETNLARLALAAAQAHERGGTLMVTPELALTGYDVGPLPPEATDPAVLGRLGRIAASAGIALVVGMALRDEGRTWNASVLIDRRGRLRATYRKAHLFGRLDRSHFAPGAQAMAVAEVDGLRVGTVICYDIEFPEPARLAALAGAQVLAVPTANMEPWGFVNEHLIPVRAFENGLHVAYANHIGHERRTRYLGRSVIAAPDGRCLRASPDEEEIVVMPLPDNAGEAGDTQATHYLRDRRPDLYGALTREDV